MTRDDRRENISDRASLMLAMCPFPNDLLEVIRDVQAHDGLTDCFSACWKVPDFFFFIRDGHYLRQSLKMFSFLLSVLAGKNIPLILHG